jgi:DNA-binding response OmpR family regulator
VPAAEPPAPKRGQGELILLVDDEKAIRFASAAGLEKWNYRVVTADTGKTGLAAFQKNRAEVQLAIIDLMMPEMSGQALIQAMRAIEPNVKIIAATGLEPGEGRTELHALGVTEILMKPYSLPQLLELVAAKLAGERAQ